MAKIKADLHPTRMLAPLRDMLLPTLRSGELRVENMQLPEGARP